MNFIRFIWAYILLLLSFTFAFAVQVLITTLIVFAIALALQGFYGIEINIMAIVVLWILAQMALNYFVSGLNFLK